MKYKKKRNKTKEVVIPPKKQIKEVDNQTFFEKHIAKYSIWILIGFIIIIGFIAFGKYITGEYLFFFKDIGSDSVNQNIPSINHRILMLKESFFSKWSFYKGMGEAHVTGFPVDPLGFVRRTIQEIGMEFFGANYYLNGSFLQTFIFHFLASGIIFFFYLRTISIKKFASFVGALLIAFSGYMVVGSAWGFASHIFKAVFLLFAFEQLYMKNRWYFFPFAVIFLSTNVFVLYLYSLFLLIYSIFRFLYEKNGNILAYIKLAGKMIVLALVGVLMKFNGLIREFLFMYNSPRVAGNASYTETLSGGEQIVEQTNLLASTFLRFFSSDILGTGSNFQGWQNYLEAPLFYVGLLTLIVFPQVFIHLNNRKKIIFGSFFGFWTLTLLIPWLRHAILAFTGDYFRYGFDFFIPFTLLFYSVYALNKLDKNYKLNLPILITTVLFWLTALFFPYSSIASNTVDANLQKIIALLILMYSGLLFLMSKIQYKSYAQIGIIILIIFELSYFSYKSYSTRVPVTKKEFAENSAGYSDGTIEIVKHLKSIDKTVFYRTEKDYQSGNAIHGSLNDAQAQGYYGTSSYSSFNQINYVRFLEETETIQKGDETASRWLRGFRADPFLLTFGSIKYFLSKEEKPRFLNSGFDSLDTKNGIKILKNRYFLPFGFTYDKFINYHNFKQLITYSVTKHAFDFINNELSHRGQTQISNQIKTNLLPLQDKVFNDKEEFVTEIKSKLSKEIFDKYGFFILNGCINSFSSRELLLNGFVVEENNNLDLSGIEQISVSDTNIFVPINKFNFEIYGGYINKLKEDTLQIKSFTNKRITGTIELQKKKMLFFTIPFDAGWKVKINGEKKELQRVNFGFTGIILPEGKHEIELFFVPQYSKVTSIISIVSIILFWLYLSFYIYRKKKFKKND